MARAQARAAQSDANLRIAPVEPAVIDVCEDAVLGRVARHRSRDQRSHQKPRDGRVPIREMIFVRLLWDVLAQGRETQAAIWAGLQIHALKAGRVRPQLQRANGVDAHSVQAVSSRLVERDDVGVNLDHVQQKILVAHPRQPVLLLVVGKARHIVDCALPAGARYRPAPVRRAESSPGIPSTSGRRRLRPRLPPGIPTTRRSVPKVSLSKKNPFSQSLKSRTIGNFLGLFLQRHRIDSQFRQQARAPLCCSRKETRLLSVPPLVISRRPPGRNSLRLA